MAAHQVSIVSAGEAPALHQGCLTSPTSGSPIKNEEPAMAAVSSAGRR